MKKNSLFPTKEEIKEELRWREKVQDTFPTNANMRRINYLRDLYKKENQK